MKTICYFRSTTKQITKHQLLFQLKATRLASYYDGTDPNFGTHTVISGSDPVTYYDDIIFELESFTMSKQEMVEKYSKFGTFISKLEAHLQILILSPIRQEALIPGDESVMHTIDLSIIKTDEEARKAKIDDIDDHSREMYASGFTYDDEQFSLSVEAQANWDSYKKKIQDGASGLVPAKWSLLNGKTYTFDTVEDLEAAYDAGFDRKKYIAHGGLDIRDEIEAASGIPNIFNISDTRE